MLQFRPGPEAERLARALIRKEYPLATSSYTRDGAEVYDPASGEVLGRADTGDWAVERAWQSAAEARELTKTSFATTIDRKEDVVNSFDELRYREGRAKAEEWANSGGRLDRDPPVSDEAFENGFADRIHELREKTREAQKA